MTDKSDEAAWRSQHSGFQGTLEQETYSAHQSAADDLPLFANSSAASAAVGGVLAFCACFVLGVIAYENGLFAYVRQVMA